MRAEQTAAIEVVGVDKAFRLPHQQRTTFKEHFLHPLHRTTYERQIALDDVSFSVDAGRVLRDHRPERQRQEHAAEDPRRHLPPGRGHGPASTALLSPFIELGVGFNPELTARDNIRINGTLLGPHAQADRRSASTRSSASPSSSASSTRS